ncbi:MAG: hypothetical protein JSU74_02985 [Candidatus Zixiibacteriota bacterium]|nr:MAG: hypothetical protein JSU74_02985 [candidate division Zixibacteria bacterium]
MSFWERAEKIDRRWIYLLVGLAVVIPFIIPMRFPVSVSPEAQSFFDAVDALPDSANVMLVFDYYPSTVAETEPMAVAAARHLFSKDCRVITLTNIPYGAPSMAESVTRRVAAEYGKEYGIDFVNLGYKYGYVSVLKGMGLSIESIFPTDNSGTPLSELPLMDSIVNYEQIAFVFEVADNNTADYWISIVNAGYGVPMGVGTTAVMAPKYYAFAGAGQIVGLLGGMKGAAEYEILLNQPDNAFRGMDIQSMVHFLIIAFVIVGNIGFFVGRTRRRSRQP